MSYFKVESLYVKRGDFELKNVSFGLEKGDFLSILGKTGSGKTLLLESIAGIYRLKGNVFLDGVDITNVPLEKRRIGLVYQDFMLFDHLTVKQNLLYSKNKDKNLYGDIVRIFGLEKLLSRKPKGLSGGEKQKVAIARALISRPKLLLLDEPLSSIDFSFRYMFIEFLKEVHKKFELTTIYVTHNLKEALSLSNKCGVLINGELVQFGPTESVFERPKSKAVAEFLGFKNILPCELVGLKDCYFSVSPYDVNLEGKGDFKIKAKVVSIDKKENIYLVKLKVGNGLIYVYSSKIPGEDILIGFNKSKVIFFKDEA